MAAGTVKMAGVTTFALGFTTLEFADMTLKVIQIVIGVLAILYGWNRWRESRYRRKLAERAMAKPPVV